jgi:CRP-like cAMP-binding protein
MERGHIRSARGNALLDFFPLEARRELPIYEDHYPSGARLFEADRTTDWLYFPHFGAVVSLTRTTEEGTTVEVGTIGREGVAGITALMLPGLTTTDAMLQLGGVVSRVPIPEFRAAMNRHVALRDVILAYAGTLIAQISQHATSNRVHTIEQRLAKWLLTARDRTDHDELELTHDFISHMLGIRRSGVTIALGGLSLDGRIRHGRRSVTILDREALARRACECYQIVRRYVLPLSQW